MCSQSISGSSLLSAYDDDDLRETSGRSRRDFEQIDAVLYDEEIAKRSSIRKICDEWSSKPHFRVRGHQCPIDRRWDEQSHLSNVPWKISSISVDTVTVDRPTSGRSSVDSTEGSDLVIESDLDEDDDQISNSGHATPHNFPTDAADSFDTDNDDDDDDNSERFSDISRGTRIKHSRDLIKCVKDNVLNQLVSSILKQYLHDQQISLQRYAQRLVHKHSAKTRLKPRPSSLPPRPRSRNRLSLPNTSSMTSTNPLFQQGQIISSSMPFRPTSEPNNELDGILLITGLKNTQTILPNSPRKSQVGVPTVPMEKPLPVDRRLQTQPTMSLVGTAMGNGSVQSAPLQPRTVPLNPRFRSATTIISNPSHNESIPRLPPISHERSNEQLMITRSNTISSTVLEPSTTSTRMVSNTGVGSNLVQTTKARRISRASRSMATKENHSTSTSPSRSLTGTAISTSTLRTTAAPRTHQPVPKRPLITTKAPASSSTSNPMKISATHIYQMTN